MGNSEITKALSRLLKPFEPLERILRYIVPSGLFGLFYILSRQPSLSPSYSWLFYASLPFIGIAFYSLHRTFFEIIDWLIWFIIEHFHPIHRMVQYIKITHLRLSRCEELRNWNYTKWATIHLSLVVAELMILFSFLFPPADPSFIHTHLLFFRRAGIFLLASGLGAYFINHLISRELCLVPNAITDEELAKSTNKND